MSENIISKFISFVPNGIKIVQQSDALYHYARVISNTRFGSQPLAIAYCTNAKEVQKCIQFCILHKEHVTFRVRSGGHQHEGMCSATGAIIIDLSGINRIEMIGTDYEKAWIPVGKQLDTVYSELEEYGKTIPGGGCQSVNVGGLTHGGGWGVSVRNFGLTCDNILAAEIILPNGELEIVSKDRLPDIFWALKGGGGGNFGVVTRFKFKLSQLTNKVTSFGLTWTDPSKIKEVIAVWMDQHAKTGREELDRRLSCTCTMVIVDPKDKELPTGQKSIVEGRMGGRFYGSEAELLTLLKDKFPHIPGAIEFRVLSEKTIAGKRKGKMSLKRGENSKKIEATPSLSQDHTLISNFLNPTGPSMNVSGDFLLPNKSCSNGRDDYLILPESPRSTCDRPHPHKISSSFPKKYSSEANREMVEKIYAFMVSSCFHSDVNKYMSFHCLGGAVRDNSEGVFAFSDKPYLLQIQSWWEDISNAFTNQARNDEYVGWVKSFRKEISVLTEGSFINFVDKDLVPALEDRTDKIKLLEIYYGKENLERLMEIKAKHDKNEVFKFQMSIPPMIYSER